MLRKLRMRLWGPQAKPPDPPAGYHVFTAKHDVEIRAEHLSKIAGRLGERTLKDGAAQLDEPIARWRVAADIAAIESTDRVLAANDGQPLQDAVATLLIDHSGSMKGQRAILAIALTEVIADFWSRLGLRYEILGFTTRSWRGGRSR